ncbi:MAG: STAS domain-containing protein [Acidobacteriaceae bacterium]|nr:STAS domain-containing protein [Acidobacteriaceae bacterium]
MTQDLVTEGESLDINVDHSDKRVVVRLRGRVGLDSSPALRDRLLAILQGQVPKIIIVDLAEVSFIDAAGIATLLEALKLARHRQSTLCLKGLHGRVVRLFQVTGLQAVFDSGCKDSPPVEVN